MTAAEASEGTSIHNSPQKASAQLNRAIAETMMINTCRLSVGRKTIQTHSEATRESAHACMTDPTMSSHTVAHIDVPTLLSFFFGGLCAKPHYSALRVEAYIHDPMNLYTALSWQLSGHGQSSL